MADQPWVLTKKLFEHIKPMAVETLDYIPQGIIAGTTILGLFTMSYATLILLLYFAEIILINRGLVRATAYLFPSVVGTTGFPNGPLFFVVAALTYLNAAIISFSDVFDAIGGEYKGKQPAAVVMSLLAIIGFFIYTVLAGKSTGIPALLATILAVIIGTLLFLAHTLIFGRDGVNILGVPILTSKTGGGKPIYACGPVVA